MSTDRQTYRPTDRRTKRPIEAPSWSLKRTTKNFQFPCSFQLKFPLKNGSQFKVLCEAHEVGFDFVFPRNNHNNHDYNNPHTKLTVSHTHISLLLYALHQTCVDLLQDKQHGIKHKKNHNFPNSFCSIFDVKAVPSQSTQYVGPSQPAPYISTGPSQPGQYSCVGLSPPAHASSGPSQPQYYKP